MQKKSARGSGKNNQHGHPFHYPLADGGPIPLFQQRPCSLLPFNSTKAPQAQPQRNPNPSPPPPLLPFDARRHEDGHGGGVGGGGGPVAAALRAQRARAHDHPAAGGGGDAAAGVGGGRGVYDAGRVHGAHALRLAHLHAGILPHALGRRPRLRLPLRRVRHQPLRDREGHPLLARRVHLLLLSKGRLHMAYISQASIHVEVKSNTGWAPHRDV